MATLYEAAGAAAGIRRLAAAWHERVLADEVVAHAFSHGFDPHHLDRLAAYWSEALGGPPEYTARYGDQSQVVRMHSGNGEHPEMDTRAIACFDAALDDAGLGEDAVLSGALHDYFVFATLHVMSAYPESADRVPDELQMTTWSWGGRGVAEPG